MTIPIKVNGQRLWQTIEQMAQIGATDKGGCNRQALTDLDQQGRDLFVRWAKALGCNVRIDQMGNLFARREGLDNSLPAIATGSHLDTQPTGGKFDGVYGVLAGLEVIATMNDHNIATQEPIDVCVWTNEEGARFSPAMIGSGVWSGEFSLEYGHSRTDKNGLTIAQELARIHYLGEHACVPEPIKAFIELHIEQGPILEQENKTIGIVKGVQGIHWYDLTLYGEPVHAGPTPMATRRDPFRAMHQIIADLYSLVEEYQPWSRVTFGDICADPGSRNTVPEKLTLAVDLRHPDQSALDEMDERFKQIVQQRCQQWHLSRDIFTQWCSPAIEFDEHCIAAVQKATQRLGYSNQRMFSGAGHDSVYVSRVAPTSMIFIPCKNGLSHNESEYASPEHVTAGANVLLNTILNL